jgi:DNA phosphorothioation-associated putative methyltransferase
MTKPAALSAIYEPDMNSLTLTSDRAPSAARTAISRTDLSRPVTQALQDNLIIPMRSVLDYGCGRGGDVRRLRELGYSVSGWDPAFAPDEPVQPADVVNLGYIINVIESATERADTLCKAWNLTRWALVVAARLDWQTLGLDSRPLKDGVITAKGTFQKFYTQYELKTWIESTLGTIAHAAAPGVFYVFRNPKDAESFRARQVRQSSAAPRRPVSQLLYEQHQDLLEQLAAFMSERGRLPDPSELEDGEVLLSAFGSVRRAFQVLGRATDRYDWSTETARARDNLLVYLALSSFGGRPRMGTLPSDLQRDIKSLFGSYRTASAEADQLLFSLRSDNELSRAVTDLPVGKILPDAMYFHATAISALPPLLRVYVGCGAVLVGAVPANVIKLHRQERKVSYLFYPEFERDPHPTLQASLRADLRTFEIRFRDFRGSANPPILHRKETMLNSDHPLYQKFARLTAQEEKADLLRVPGIGRRNAWNRLLQEEGWKLAGHRLLKKNSGV